MVVGGHHLLEFCYGCDVLHCEILKLDIQDLKFRRKHPHSLTSIVDSICVNLKVMFYRFIHFQHCLTTQFRDLVISHELVYCDGFVTNQFTESSIRNVFPKGNLPKSVLPNCIAQSVHHFLQIARDNGWHCELVTVYCDFVFNVGAGSFYCLVVVR